MRQRHRRGTIVGLLTNLVLTLVGGTAIVFFALRFGLVPTSVLGSSPAQTAVSAASTAAPAIIPAIMAAQQDTASATVPGTSGTPISGVAGRASPLAVAVSAPTPSASVVKTDPTLAATQFLQYWEKQRYPDMYKLLSVSARQTIAEDRFVGRYQAITLGANLNSVAPLIQGSIDPPGTSNRAIARYKVKFTGGRLGEFSEDNQLPLVFEDGNWKVDWTPGLIFRDLTADRSVRFLSDDPVRGAILDRTGQPLAAQGKIVTLGVVPGRLKDANAAINAIAKFLGVPPESIRSKLAPAKPDWWVPFRDFPLDRKEEIGKKFAGFDGVLVEEKEGRIYPSGPIAAHVVGFVTSVNPEDLKTLAVKGYEEGDLVGRAGVERQAEETLAGTRGGKLLIADSAGETIRVIYERPAKNGATLHLTIDIGIQTQVDKAVGERVGSMVVMDPRDNSVIALVSKPSYDPNGFIVGFSDEQWKKLSEDPRRPFQPRASTSTYPIGSVFKTVTMAAGLEKGGYQSNSPFVCNGKWAVLDPKKPMGDWIPQGHGKLDLAQGLVESCDIVFYDVGHKLNGIDNRILSDYAHQFGFGDPTGIVGLSEVEGIVSSPDWKKMVLRQDWFAGDAVNLAIGQGYLDATPLQVANSYAVLANGGVLRTPLLIKKIVPADGSPVKEFQSQERGRVSVSPQNLSIIRDALKRVASTTRGTAFYAFNGYRIPVAAKTGSAENQYPDAHAWFAGFGPIDDPRIVITVMIEGGRTGAEVAAPLGRQGFEMTLGK